MGVAGRPTLTDRVDGAGMRVVVISASWHEEVMAGLRAGAKRALEDANVLGRSEKWGTVGFVDWISVPGTFELPVAAARAAVNVPSAIVALGVVIRGGTPHFDYVCQAATVGLTEVATRTGVPIGFGVLTCDDEEQALARSGLPGSQEDKGYDATMAAIRTALVLRQLPMPK